MRSVAEGATSRRPGDNQLEVVKWIAIVLGAT
jgi:hypothetical protein